MKIALLDTAAGCVRYRPAGPLLPHAFEAMQQAGEQAQQPQRGAEQDGGAGQQPAPHGTA